MLWQIAYSELYFTEKKWPDFRREDLKEAIINYQQREREDLGKLSKILKHIILIITVIIFSSNYSIAQDTAQYNFVDYTQPKEYILSKVNIIGTKYVNKSNIIDISD